MAEFSFSNVKEQSGYIWKDRVGGWAIRISLVFVLIELVMIFVGFSKLPPQVPLFYSRPWGEGQLAPPLSLLWLPGLSLAILLFNSLIGGLMFGSEKILSRMMLMISSVVSFLAWFTLTRIFFLIY